MKRVRFFAIFLMAICLFFSPIFGEEKQQKLKNWEFIPNVSASGTPDRVAANFELRAAGRFFLNHNKSWFIFGQAGFMYNIFENKNQDQKFSEWQLGFEPLVGFGTRHIRLSGFLNSLNLKMWDIERMPFTEVGVRFTLAPWKKFHFRVRGFATWPVSDPILIFSDTKEIEYENNEGVFLQKKTTQKWAKQEESFGGNIDLGIGKKLIFGLEGFVSDKDYQVGGGLQYKVFKKKPWVINANIFYTDFQGKNYLYVHNIFPGMFDEKIQGWTAKIGISNSGGINNIDFTDFQMQIAEPLYFSPVIWYFTYVTPDPQKISDPHKLTNCDINVKCLDAYWLFCETGGKAPFTRTIFIEGTEETIVGQSRSFNISHHFQKSGTYPVVVSSTDALGNTQVWRGETTIDDCSKPKTYKLTVETCVGVTGTPASDVYEYPAGTKVKYSYKLKDGYENLVVTIDNLTKPVSGEIIMNANHYLKADCSKEKEYKLIIKVCKNGVAGFPETGVYYYKAGTKVNYSYEIKDGYMNLVVTIDGLSKPASGQIIMNANHTLEACYGNCISAEIIEFGVKPTTVEYKGSATFYWRVKHWTSIEFSSGENLASLTHLESGDIYYGEKTYPNLTADLTKELAVKNDCPSIAKASATVTVKQCDKCAETGIHDDGGSDTKNWNNLTEGNISKSVTLYNNGYCNWNNFLIRAKVEEQQGSNRRACAVDYINLPARSSITITINYNNTNRTISFVIGAVVPLSSSLPMSLNDLPGYEDVDPGAKIKLFGNEDLNSYNLQCVQLKMTFATECGAQFSCN